MTDKTSDAPRFVFATCQVGAEDALKHEVLREWPSFRFSYSRPGFVTFKIQGDEDLRPDFDLRSVFARTYGLSIGRVGKKGESVEQMAEDAWRLFGNRLVRQIHVWERDAAAPGQKQFEPGLTPDAQNVYRALLSACSSSERLVSTPDSFGAPAAPGDFVMDCVIVSPHEWWIGYHRAKEFSSLTPGGMLDLQLPEDAASRAWLKFDEGLRWSELPIPEEARWADIGSAPGGSSQALLQHGYEVWGIDPATVAPQVLAHPQFTHLRKKAADVRRRDLRKIRWVMADMNVAPKYTLEVLESLTMHPEINIRGMLFTLKLLEWKLAAEIPAFLEQVQGWGFQHVKARQLQYNRQEICISALKHPFKRKPIHVKHPDRKS
jgi:23S rRNA (cytidine2498-2'-O)-methyltransferase